MLNANNVGQENEGGSDQNNWEMMNASHHSWFFTKKMWEPSFIHTIKDERTDCSLTW